MIKTLAEGGEIEGLNELNQYINDETFFETDTITQADIDANGL